VLAVLGLALLSSLREGFIGPIALVSGIPDEMIWQWVMGACCLTLTLLVSRIINQEFIHGYIERSWHVKVPSLIGDIGSGVVIFIGGCAVLSLVFKQNISALIVAGAGSAALLGFALKDFAVALATGIMLNFEDTFKVGDKVQIDEFSGVVHQITWRNTVLMTDSLEAIYIPNVKISDAVVTNLDFPSPNIKRIISLNIDYDVSAESAERVLYAATLGAVGVKFSMPPKVYARGLTESGVKYEIHFVLTNYRDQEEAEHAIFKSILECMRVADITIFSGAAPQDRIKITNRSLDVFHLVQQVTLFNRLSKGIWEQIARELVAHRYLAGEIIVRAGERRDSIFIVAEGIASRTMVDPDDHLIQRRFIATEFFGRQALFGFMQHAASVIAETDVLVYELSHVSLARLIKANPDLLNLLANTLAELNWREGRALSAGETLSPEELTHLRNIYLGQLEANYSSSLS